MSDGQQYQKHSALKGKSSNLEVISVLASVNGSLEMGDRYVTVQDLRFRSNRHIVGVVLFKKGIAET